MNNKRLRWLIPIVLLSVFFELRPDLKLYTLTATWIYIIVYCLKKIEVRAILLAFETSIFIFIMPRLLIPLFYVNDYIFESLNNTITFRPDTYIFIYNAVFISIISVFLGYFFCEKTIQKRLSFIPDSLENLKIRKAAKICFYITLSFSILVTLEKVYFVWSYGYFDYYLDYVHHLPSIFYKFESVFPLSFYLFLATLPSKKECKTQILIYLLYNTFTLFIGGRTEFVLSVLFLIIYGFLRNHLSPNDLWITAKRKLIILFSIPVISIAMFVVLLIRGGSDDANEITASYAINLVFQQGSSVQVLGLTYEGNVPKDKLYSFGLLIDKYNDNFIFHLLGIAKSYKSQTMEMALYGHSLSNYLTYTYETDRFFRGGGLGSSYIAEVWNDFGYWGLFFWSVMYGVILAKIYSWFKNNVWISALSFFMMMDIIYSPRAYAIGFIANIISPVYFIVLLIIYLYSKKIRLIF